MREQVSYTPILKGKVNDLKALGRVPRTFIPRMSPLIELLSPNEGEALDDSTNRFVHQLRKHCPLHTFSVDLHAIPPGAYFRDGTPALEAVFFHLRGLDLRFIPVFGFDHEPELWDRIVPVVHREGRGLTIRLKTEDLELADEVLSELIDRLQRAGIPAESTHLLIDLGSLSELEEVDMVRLRESCQDFIELAATAADFQRISLAGSSMPRDVGQVPVEGRRTYRRRELSLWADAFASLPSTWVGYGDYGVVHPNFSDKIIATNANAKIRYTGQTEHHIFRGYNLKQELKYLQYHELAQRVVSSDVYRGRNFSYGDDRTWLCAHREIGCGNLGTWVEADMNHHLVFAAAQLPRLESLLVQGASADEALLVG